MRLWHWKLISLLPKSQLLGQWRELNSIYRKQDKHILINYIYTDGQHTDHDFLVYSVMVITEMRARGYKVNTDNFCQYFNIGKSGTHEAEQKICDIVARTEINHWKPFPKYHDFEYLEICYWNLREKHLRGQKDFTDKIWMEIMALHEMEFFNKHIKGETK